MIELQAIKTILRRKYADKASCVTIAGETGITRQTVSKICKYYQDVALAILNGMNDADLETYLKSNPWVRDGGKNSKLNIVKDIIDATVQQVSRDNFGKMSLRDAIDAVQYRLSQIKVVQDGQPKSVDVHDTTVRRYLLKNYPDYFHDKSKSDRTANSMTAPSTQKSVNSQTAVPPCSSISSDSLNSNQVDQLKPPISKKLLLVISDMIEKDGACYLRDDDNDEEDERNEFFDFCDEDDEDIESWLSGLLDDDNDDEY